MTSPSPSEDGGAVDLRSPPVERLSARLRRWWRSQGRHPGLRHWVLYRGMPLALFSGVVFVANGVLVGWRTAYDVLVGITSPAATRDAVVAWPLSIVGWLFVPALVGALAGYVVSDQISSRRKTPLERVFPDSADE